MHRKGQFSLHLPEKNFKTTGVHAVANATVQDRNTLVCHIPSVTTTGNTTICITKLGDAVLAKEVCGASPVWAPLFIEHYALMKPAFDRRPYFREATGTMLLDVDSVLHGASVTVTVTLGQQTHALLLLNTTFTVTQQYYALPFSLSALPKVRRDLRVGTRPACP